MMRFFLRYSLFFVLAIGALFRFYNPNWDSGFHLHPDERFLTMVGNAMRVPQSISEYLDPTTSLFNPANVGYAFFVYGTLPLTLNKLLAILLQNDTYDRFALQGRLLSGFVDILVILFVFKTAKLFEKHLNFHKNIKYFASFFYAIAVLPIQLSHFFAVDTFLNFFMFASFYFILRFSYERKLSMLSLSAVLLGCAFASKATALFILPLHLVFLKKGSLGMIHFGKHLLLFFAILYLSLRIADPYLFENGNFLNPGIDKTFLENINALKRWEGEDVWYPPGVQWINKPPIVFSAANIALLGIGVPYVFFLLLGLFVFIKKYLRTALIAIPLWTVGFFLFQSTQFVKAMRYFIFIYPLLALFAGFGFWSITKNLKRAPIALFLLILFIWPVMFSSIYTRKNTRVAASEWMYESLENGSIILGEHWDDPLPLPVRTTYGKQFTIKQLPVFDPDTDEKWQTMNALLTEGNYLVLSSNRGWGSIPTVPEKYPLMSKFYENLFGDKLQYRKVKEFTSYPTLEIGGWKLEVPDGWADESFTVYDHPMVMVFRKVTSFLRQ